MTRHICRRKAQFPLSLVHQCMLTNSASSSSLRIFWGHGRFSMGWCPNVQLVLLLTRLQMSRRPLQVSSSAMHCATASYTGADGLRRAGRKEPVVWSRMEQESHSGARCQPHRVRSVSMEHGDAKKDAHQASTSSSQREVVSSFTGREVAFAGYGPNRGARAECCRDLKVIVTVVKKAVQ